jgi:phosphatidylglycerophosphatase GEP4
MNKWHLSQWLNWPALNILMSEVVIKRNYSLLRPNLTVNTLANISWLKLKTRGIRVVLLDKDNTLTQPYTTDIHSDLKGSWMQCCQTFGRDRVFILSNSMVDDDGDFHGVRVLKGIRKPGGGPEVMAYLHSLDPRLEREQVCIVGDRLMTDIVMGGVNGWFSVLITQLIDHRSDNLMVKCMRRLEAWIMK